MHVFLRRRLANLLYGRGITAFEKCSCFSLLRTTKLLTAFPVQVIAGEGARVVAREIDVLLSVAPYCAVCARAIT